MTAKIHLPAMPAPAGQHIAIHLTPSAERAIRAGHPWLFDQGIRRQSHTGPAGTLAVLFDRKRRFLAVGLYDPDSPIRVRVLQAGTPATIGTAWFQARLAAAYAHRAVLHQSPGTTGYRLVHGENDGLPGLVLDRYDQVGVLKLDTAAWLPHLPALLPALLAVVPLKQVVLRLSRRMAQASLPAQDGAPVYDGAPVCDGRTIVGEAVTRPVLFLENGLQFAADVVQGQKTGFFFDHRDNRARVETLAEGRETLNVFAYSGAFSLYAARGGAPVVLSLDGSRPALDAAGHNFQLNRHLPPVAAARHELLVADAFAALPNLHAAGRRFDLVIIDPPTLAKSQPEVPGALAAYRRLVESGVRLLRPGGILVMASCTARVSEAQFFATVHQSAQAAGRSLRELARTGHALDHPVSFREGAYLKCLFATVG